MEVLFSPVRWIAHCGPGMQRVVLPSGSLWEGHEGYVTAVAYSPDGSRIVSGSNDNTIRVWDSHAGTPIGEPMKGHDDVINGVAYSQDGNTIISASENKTIRFWNVADGTPTGALRRGESRWDRERQCFVSVPCWWPCSLWRAFTEQALVYSANPLYIPDDGWIRTLDDRLFLWIPPEHRNCSCHAAAERTMTTNPNDERLGKSVWKDLAEERDWTKSIDVDQRDSSDGDEGEYV